MEDSAEKIIVYKAYDTVMEANLAKTKLDAYGIPCFLTDENFVNMYPIRNDVFPGVRLFIFERDLDQVRETMAIGNNNDSETPECPKCLSKNFESRSSDTSTVSKLFLGLFLSPILASVSPKNKYFHCNDCNNDWI